MKKNLIPTKELKFRETLAGITNEVKLKRDLLCELMKAKMGSNPESVQEEEEPNPGSYKAWLRHWNCPFDLLPSCGYRISGKRVKEGLGRLDRKVEIGGIIGTGLNRVYNRQLMNHYKALKETSHRGENSRRKGWDYWSIVGRLFRHPAYWLAVLTAVDPQWPYGGAKGKLTEKKVRELLRDLLELGKATASNIPNLEFRRVYIPKGGKLEKGKARPLGVPSLKWRIYTRALNHALVYFYKERLINQHAYQQGKSTTTAWAQILREMDKSNIYEFDLKGFFDNVTHDGIEAKLKEYGVPEAWVTLIIKLCKNVPKLKDTEEEDLLDEPDRNIKYLPDGTPNPGFRRSGKPPEDYKTRGVPQGAAFSCGLSILCNQYLGNRKDITIINYADDGIIFSENPVDPETTINSKKNGITYSPEKSSPIKGYGVPERGLKFVGLTLTSGKLKSTPRNGSMLEIDKGILEEHFSRSWWSKIVESHKKLYQEETAPQEQEESPDKDYKIDGMEIKKIEDSKPTLEESISDWLSKRGETDPWYKEGWKSGLARIGKNINRLQKKSCGKNSILSALMESSWSGSLISKLYNGTWSLEQAEVPEEENWPKSWVDENLGRKMFAQPKELPEVIGPQPYEVIKRLQRRLKRSVRKYGSMRLGNESTDITSMACHDVLQRYFTRLIESGEDYQVPKAELPRISFHVGLKRGKYTQSK
jgi:hypothetical protein